MNVPALPSLRGFFRVLTGSSSVRESARRQTRLEALLGRDTEPAPISFEQSRALAGKSVLVTGAGGSIGSEVCRRLLYYGPAHLILVEMSEAALYEIDLELRELQRGASGCEITPSPISVWLMMPLSCRMIIQAAVRTRSDVHKGRSTAPKRTDRFQPCTEAAIIAYGRPMTRQQNVTTPAVQSVRNRIVAFADVPSGMAAMLPDLSRSRSSAARRKASV